MKVWFLASWWPTRVHPTHGNFIQKQARVVAKHHELTILAIQEDAGLDVGAYEMTDNFAMGYREVVVYFGRPPGTTNFRNIMSRIGAYLKGLYHLRRNCGRPDLYHAHILLDSGIMAAALGRIQKVPILISEHSSIYRIPNVLRSPRDILVAWACRNARFLLPVSESLHHAMETDNSLAGTYRVVPNVVDTQCFVPGNRSALDREADFRLLHVSNFDPKSKNVEGLLRAFRMVSNDHPVFHLHLAGDGDLLALKKVVRDLGFSETEVTTSGPHSEMGVAKLMREHDAVVHFSNYETQGIVLMEAQACGLPVVATRVGGVPEIVIDGYTGFLVEAEDEIALSEKILSVRSSYDIFDRSAIRNRVVDNYSEAAIRKKLEEVYTSARGPINE